MILLRRYLGKRNSPIAKLTAPWKETTLFTKTVSWKGNSSTSKMTAPWKETTLPTIFSKYKLDETYNADELGLLFGMQPNKSLKLCNETCVGRKHSKIFLTGMTAANPTGDKLPLFVIAK